MHIGSQWVRAGARVALVVAISLAPLTASHGAAGRWSNWEGLGGILTSEPSGASWWVPVQLHVFARGADNALWQKWYAGGWSNWQRLGGALTSAPSVAAESGRLNVFARGLDNALWHTWYDSGRNKWSNWESLGGVLTSAPSAVWGRYPTSDPSGVGTTGRLDVFVRGADNALWHKWYDMGSNSWSNWESLGGVLTSAPSAARGTAPAMTGRLDVLVRGADNALWHRWGDYSSRRWSDWESLGGVLTSGPSAASVFTNRLDVFVRGADNALWHRWYTWP